MDHKDVFAALQKVCSDVISAVYGSTGSSRGENADRLLGAVKQIQEHGRAVEPLITGLTSVYQHFDLDAETPGNGYRTLVKVVLSCTIHIIQKASYIASRCGGPFFRMDHNVAEMEAYGGGLRQLRGLLYLAQVLLNDNEDGQLHSQQEGGLSETFVQEYISMHKACFYGRCLGFQFSPSLRPFLQTVVTGMVSYGEHYKKQQTGLGIAALSFFTCGKYVMDPDLRGAEFERITQNLDLQFWKTFWNVTETELLSVLYNYANSSSSSIKDSLCRIASSAVEVNLALTVPAESLSLPLTSDPTLSVSVTPPVAHWGSGPVNMRLISHTRRQGQDSAELLAFSRPEGPQLPQLPQLPQPEALNRPTAPLSPCLLIHFHGGGFVAQTSKSHESYLKSWSKDLEVPVLSVDYSLAPEAPFPRALEECFYTYCWALKNCHLLGSTAERVCLVGDSAGGNLCLAVCMRAMSHGMRVPDGIVTAYPVTLLTTDASPSRLLTLIDPLLPLSVLYKCIDAYAGSSSPPMRVVKQIDTLTALGQDTVKLFNNITKGATSWLQSVKDQITQVSSSSSTPSNGISASASHTEDTPPKCKEYPENFEPLRSHCLVDIQTPCTLNMKNPFVSPLLAPDNLLNGLPPVHLVVSALDALLDDSVMFAKKLRNMNQPVTLSVVEDLPHGFLSFVQLSKVAQEASDVCVKRIREVLQKEETAAAHKQP